MKRIDFDFVEQHFPCRPDDAHKGTMGTLCSLTGSFGFSGAAVLSAKAALRTGVGLHYQIIPACIYPIFASSVYESVCVPVQGNAKREVLSCAKCPVVIDADGINALARHIHILDDAKREIILTPHVKEFSRLSGMSVEEILRAPAQAAADFAKKRSGVTLVLKGHRTYVAKGDAICENIAGNSGMAKGGSGDVLAGIIASLSAQGAQPFDAAVMGVHIHALAGDIAAAKLSRTAMLPSDIIRSLPEIYRMIEDNRDNGAS